jgi:hypothetical protein
MAFVSAGYRRYGPDHIEIRLAQPSDQRALEALAALDSKRMPSGPTLVGVVDGVLAAAVPLDGSPPLADPFRPTEGLVHLLRFRAVELRDEHRGRRQSPLRARLGLAVSKPATPV